MAQKIILVADPGIDTAFAVALALHDPTLDVIGLIASAGNIPADRATQMGRTAFAQRFAPGRT